MADLRNVISIVQAPVGLRYLHIESRIMRRGTVVCLALVEDRERQQRVVAPVDERGLILVEGDEGSDCVLMGYSDAEIDRVRGRVPPVSDVGD